MDKGILYFSAPWCGPCKAPSPQMEEIAKSITLVVYNIYTNVFFYIM